jgi:hypothetical protein
MKMKIKMGRTEHWDRPSSFDSKLFYLVVCTSEVAGWEGQNMWVRVRHGVKQLFCLDFWLLFIKKK